MKKRSDKTLTWICNSKNSTQICLLNAVLCPHNRMIHFWVYTNYPHIFAISDAQKVLLLKQSYTVRDFQANELCKQNEQKIIYLTQCTIAPMQTNWKKSKRIR